MPNNNKLIKNYLNELISNNLEIELRQNNIEEWLDICNKAEYVPYSYTNSWINYFIEYEKSNYDLVIDCSIIIKQNNVPVGIIPAFYLKHSDNSKNKFMAYIPIFLDLNKKNSIKKLFKKYFISINNFCTQQDTKSIQIKIPFLGNLSFPIWGYEYFKLCSSYAVTPEIYINLQLLHSEIEERIRSTTMHRINKSIKNYKVRFLDVYNSIVWKKFKSLHHSASKFITRSDNTWDIQLLNIKNHHAIYLYIEGEKNKLISGCYFDFSKDECNYSVSVTDGNNKDKSLNHLILYSAIHMMQKKRIKYLRLGDINLSCDNIVTNDKINKILLFKEAFYTDIYLSYNLYFESKKLDYE